MKHFLIIILFIITGCSSTPLIYNPFSVSVKQLSTVKASYSKPYNSKIKFIYLPDGTEIIKRSSWENLLREVSLKPGHYKFKLWCTDGIRYAYPEIQTKIIKSKNYKIYCSGIKGENIFGIKGDFYVKAIIKAI